jgi:pentatricopeptide repeat protein
MSIENTNAEIKSCAEFGDQDKAAGLLSEALQAGLPVDIVTYNGVMEACAKSGDVPKAAEVALSLLGEMPQNRVRPDPTTLYNVMAALIKAGQFKSGYNLLDEMDKGSFAYMQKDAYFVYALLRDHLKEDWDTKFDVGPLYNEPKSGWKLHVDIQSDRMNKIWPDGKPEYAGGTNYR